MPGTKTAPPTSPHVSERLGCHCRVSASAQTFSGLVPKELYPGSLSVRGRACPPPFGAAEGGSTAVTPSPDVPGHARVIETMATTLAAARALPGVKTRPFDWRAALVLDVSSVVSLTVGRNKSLHPFRTLVSVSVGTGKKLPVQTVLVVSTVCRLRLYLQRSRQASVLMGWEQGLQPTRHGLQGCERAGRGADTRGVLLFLSPSFALLPQPSRLHPLPLRLVPP